jgi:nucleoside-diphosphate-sugar epimerase
MTKPRLAITGSSGRIGRVLMEELQDDFELVGFDRVPGPVPAGAFFVSGEVADRKALGKALAGADAVVHLAGIPYDIPPLHQVFEVNMQGTYNALELAVEGGAKVFMHASSIMAYGFGQNAEPQYLPVDEAHPLLADRPYGLSKALGEELCLSFTRRCGLTTLCFRLTTAVDLRSERIKKFFPWREKQGEVGIFQYFDMRDFADLVKKAAGRTDLGHEAFLVSSADSGHVDPTGEVAAKFYPEAQLRYTDLQDLSPFVSIDKAQRMLGYEPRFSWREETGMADSP